MFMVFPKNETQTEFEGQVNRDSNFRKLDCADDCPQHKVTIPHSLIPSGQPLSSQCSPVAILGVIALDSCIKKCNKPASQLICIH
ncbi:hypothetical protein L596_003267 [Steinernema carpocapsae]|uniref:Uncharacterized protein n=1 Tax=Steinernema carpocapsae TaxID=34508 RepID=A0A4U8URX5_STECR|nr:hypothetical protein L596_003267 [Steinernema carpocapsae]